MKECTLDRRKERMMKLDSTFFADFLFGGRADREDCKSTMNTTSWRWLLPFSLSSVEAPGCRMAFQPSFYLKLLRSHRLNSSWVLCWLIRGRKEILCGGVHFAAIPFQKGEKGIENLTWKDSFRRNPFCQTSSGAAPPLEHRKSGWSQSTQSARSEIWYVSNKRKSSFIKGID